MLELIIGGYAALVWLLCIKLKVIPWNIKTQVGAVAGAIALSATIIFTINVVTPHPAMCGRSILWLKWCHASPAR
ncbi:MAG: hypothetical protein IPL05_06800 [Betaproteobacteria bacterium]|nr:hypothetical protein [Betaproteobacteria bacterium]